MVRADMATGDRKALMRGYGGHSRIGRRRPPGPVTLVAAALATAALATACSAPAADPPAATFTPGAGAGTGTAAPSASSSGGTGADSFVMPPFGSNFHVTMTDWLPPAGSQLVPAVVAAKNFWLAFYYSEYTGGKDNRWRTYTSGAMQPLVQKTLRAPDVAGQSMIGSMSFGGMSAAPDPKISGDIDVTICIDGSKLTDTYLGTGKAFPTQVPRSQADYKETAYVAQGSTGLWYMTYFTNQVTVPAAQGCGA
jgi:hypothetical protein